MTFHVCRSGTDEQYEEKKKLLQDIADLKHDGEECRRVLALAKKAEADAKKRSSDLRLLAMRTSKTGDMQANPGMYCYDLFLLGGELVFFFAVIPNMEREQLVGEENSDSDNENACQNKASCVL